MSSTTSTLYDPATHPVAAAYAAASTAAECRAARRQWAAVDEERGYRLTVDFAEGMHRGEPIPSRRESLHPLRCLPSELQGHLYEWASALAAELTPQTAMYWFVVRAYPVSPRTGRSDHGLMAEYILAVHPKHPDAPSCEESDDRLDDFMSPGKEKAKVPTTLPLPAAAYVAPRVIG